MTSRLDVPFAVPEPVVLGRVRRLMRHRYLIIPTLIAFVVLIGLLKDGPGWWISTAASACLLCGCLGFFLGIDFADRWSEPRENMQTWRTRNGSPD